MKALFVFRQAVGSGPSINHSNDILGPYGKQMEVN